MAKKLAPSIFKLMASLATAGFLNSKIQDDAAKALADCVGSAAGGLIEDQLENFEETMKGFAKFKELLAQIAQECVEKTKSEKHPGGFPLIIIIDELDRCRPTFALTFLERIKHFFNIDNVVFMLMVNKIQLIEYIKGLYGAGIDADAYLEKFINLSINLTSLPPGQPRSNCYEYANRCPLAPKQNDDATRERLNEAFRKFLLEYSKFNYVPLRCIDKYYSYIGFVDTRVKPHFAWYVGILVLLKLLRPSLYNDFIHRDEKATTQVLELMAGQIKAGSFGAQELKTLIKAAIACYLNQTDDPKPYCQDFPACAGTITRSCQDITQPQDAFFRAAQFIDFMG